MSNQPPVRHQFIALIRHRGQPASALGRQALLAVLGPAERSAMSEGRGGRLSGITNLQVGSALAYLLAFVLPCLDAVLPVLPSETVIIAFGVATAGSTDPRVFLLVACAALGAFTGDNLAYLIGWRFAPRVERRFFKGEKGAARRDWAERSLARFGTALIIACRFIPGGRTAVTLCCGLVRYPWRRFAIATAIAAVAWAGYAFLAGRLGGKAFEDKPLVGFAVAFGGVLLVSGIIELARRVIARRRRRTGRHADHADPPGGQATSHPGE